MFSVGRPGGENSDVGESSYAAYECEISSTARARKQRSCSLLHVHKIHSNTLLELPVQGEFFLV
jgi:hypothetical protein